MVEKVTIPFVGVPPLGVAVNEMVAEKLIVNDDVDVGRNNAPGTRNFGSEGASNEGADVAGVSAGNGAVSLVTGLGSFAIWVPFSETESDAAVMVIEVPEPAQLGRLRYKRTNVVRPRTKGA
jgi:hypothetical protein